MKYVTFSFVAFAIFIGTLVFICMKQSVPLVSSNYYEEELVFSKKQKQKQNAQTLAVQPKVSVKGNQLIFWFDQMDEVQSGQLKLTRPSDQLLDETFEIKKTPESEQIFTLANPQKGLYRLNVIWRMNDKEYFVEKLIVL